MKTVFFSTCAAAALAFAVGCAENPADNVPSADVSSVEGDGAGGMAPAESGAGADAEATPDIVSYVFTEDSKIGFVGSKVTGSHEGGFKTFTGGFAVAGDELASGTHQIVIDMDSTWSDSEKLTGHLKNADFFDVETYPESTFVLTSVEAIEEGGTHRLEGELTLHGVTRKIAFPATVTVADEQVTLTSEFSINRFDFGIEYPGKADDLIRKEVVIKLDLRAVPDGSASA